MENYETGRQNHNFFDDGTGEFLKRKTVRVIEEVEDYIDIKIPKKHRINNGRFITLFQECLNDIICNANLSKNEMQLLIYLIANANYQGSVNLTYKELVTNLKLDTGNISKAVKGLVNRNIIIKSTSNGNKYKKQPNFYDLSLNNDRLNYNLAWKGKNKDYKQVQGKDPVIIHQLLENKKNELFPNETI
jgi:hypothetical protein